ncbi:hypothetical protein DEO72_LG2g3509 [Vigna unguiculata]|uniref:Uncharacterized protein n=1 Tax=Vigna unguiculata TaxID=3917 RepID=A0A4D6L3V1_VIGUN|nr:hypothetical protein DEO72_LG2g3509 [Vigna unguiculata]
MAEIQGSVVAADVNDDGKIELVSADAHGNVAVWTPKGDLVWEKHLKSLIPQNDEGLRVSGLSKSKVLLGQTSP